VKFYHKAYEKLYSENKKIEGTIYYPIVIQMEGENTNKCHGV